MQAEFAEEQPRLTPNGALIAFRSHVSLTIEKIEKPQSELLTTYSIKVTDMSPGTWSNFAFRWKRKARKSFSYLNMAL